MGLRKYVQSRWKAVLLFVIIIFALYSTFLYLTVGQRGYDDVLVKLSNQFLNKKLTLSIYNLPIRDISNYYNNYYVYFGPLSSILLMPLVLLFGEAVPQVLIGVLSMTASFIAVYLIGRQFKFSSMDSLWLSVFFVFSTVLFSSSVINIAAYQVEALGVPFILFAVWLYLTKRNLFLVGLFIGLAVMTRFTLVLSCAFFFMEMLQRRLSVKQFILLLIPVILALGLLGAYNQRRFHSILETGYNYSITKNDGPIGRNFVYGDVSPVHVPANLYSMLLMGPEPLLLNKDGGMILKFPYLKLSPWGVAIWFTSPLFLFLILKFRAGKHSLSAGITAVVISLPVIFWYSIGYAQVGYRYTLDFLPFLFLLLLPVLAPKLSKTAIVLIIIGVVINCVYTDSIWEIYPLFNIYP